MVISEIQLENIVETVNLDVIFNTPTDIERQGMHLALLQRFMSELKIKYPEKNGEVNLNFAANEWVRGKYHERFNNSYFIWKLMPNANADMIYKEVTRTQ